MIEKPDWKTWLQNPIDKPDWNTQLQNLIAKPTIAVFKGTSNSDEYTDR
jgi:hypothetical protein